MSDTCFPMTMMLPRLQGIEDGRSEKIFGEVWRVGSGDLEVLSNQWVKLISRTRF